MSKIIGAIKIYWPKYISISIQMYVNVLFDKYSERHTRYMQCHCRKGWYTDTYGIYTCCSVLYCPCCQVVFSKIDVMRCHWARFTLNQLSWWCISDWPVFSKLNFLSWRLSRSSCLYSAGITKQYPACVWQPESIPTSYPNSAGLGSWQG